MDSPDMELKGLEALSRKKRLKQLLDKGLQIENGVVHQDSTTALAEIRNIINASDGIVNEGTIADRAERTGEVLMDAQVLKMSHELIGKVVIQTSKYSDTMYQNAINRIVENNFISDWHKITRRACKIAHVVRAKSTMLGVIDTQLTEPTIKERLKRKRTKLAKMKKPEAVDKMKRKDMGAAKLKIIYDQLATIFSNNSEKPLPYYQLIIDPDNFMNTIENAFQMSFLANENRIAIQTGDDGYPHVRLTHYRERGAENTSTSQSICSLNTQICKDMINLYDIKKPMLQVPFNIDEDD